MLTLSFSLRERTYLTDFKRCLDGDVFIEYQEFNLSPLMGMVVILSFCYLRRSYNVYVFLCTLVNMFVGKFLPGELVVGCI